MVNYVATLGSILDSQLAETLASFSLQDGATKWQYNHDIPTYMPPNHINFLLEILCPPPQWASEHNFMCGKPPDSHQILLTQNFFWPKKFLDPKIFLTQQNFLPKDFLSKNFFDPKIFLTQNFFWSKNYLPQKFCATKFFDLEIFWPKFFLTKIFFYSNIFLT